jgi:hypothetical protein
MIFFTSIWNSYFIDGMEDLSPLVLEIWRISKIQMMVPLSLVKNVLDK